MPDAFHHSRSSALAGTFALALAFLATALAVPATGRSAEFAPAAQREMRAAPGSGQRGWLTVPAWAVWSAGGALAAAAACSLILLARNGGRR